MNVKAEGAHTTKIHLLLHMYPETSTLACSHKALVTAWCCPGAQGQAAMLVAGPLAPTPS